MPQTRRLLIHYQLDVKFSVIVSSIRFVIGNILHQQQVFWVGLRTRYCIIWWSFKPFIWNFKNLTVLRKSLLVLNAMMVLKIILMSWDSFFSLTSSLYTTSSPVCCCQVDVNGLRKSKYPYENPSLQFWLICFHQLYLSNLLANFETFNISCHVRKSESLIKHVILIIYLVHLRYSVCKNSIQNVCRKVLTTQTS